MHSTYDSSTTGETLVNVYVRVSKVTDYLVPVTASSPGEAKWKAKKLIGKDARAGTLKKIGRMGSVECTALSDDVDLETQVSEIARKNTEQELQKPFAEFSEKERLRYLVEEALVGTLISEAHSKEEVQP